MGSRLEILWREVIEHVSLHLRCRGGNEPFGRFVDESQKRIPLRLLDIAIEKVDPEICLERLLKLLSVPRAVFFILEIHRSSGWQRSHIFRRRAPACQAEVGAVAEVARGVYHSRTESNQAYGTKASFNPRCCVRQVLQKRSS